MHVHAKPLCCLFKCHSPHLSEHIRDNINHSYRENWEQALRRNWCLQRDHMLLSAIANNCSAVTCGWSLKSCTCYLSDVFCVFMSVFSPWKNGNLNIAHDYEMKEKNGKWSRLCFSLRNMWYMMPNQGNLVWSLGLEREQLQFHIKSVVTTVS